MEDTIPGKLDDLTKRVGKIEAQLEENTAVTKEIRDALIAGRFLARLVAWATPLVAIGAATWVWVKDHLRTH